MTQCDSCNLELKDSDKKKKRGNYCFHIKCLRKIRKLAKKKYYGQLDKAINEIIKKENITERK